VFHDWWSGGRLSVLTMVSLHTVMLALKRRLHIGVKSGDVTLKPPQATGWRICMATLLVIGALWCSTHFGPRLGAGEGPLSKFRRTEVESRNRRRLWKNGCSTFPMLLPTLQFFEECSGRIGSAYGGWTMCIRLLNAASVVYSFGVGRDITWDLEVIRETNCIIHAFDNTPVHEKWWKQVRNNVSARFVRHPWLLSSENGVVEMGLPRGHAISYSPLSASAKGFQNAKTIKLDAFTLQRTMSILGHDKIDMLKLDIEGAEFSVLQNLSRSFETLPTHPIPACQLLVEFHSRLFRERRDMVKEAHENLNKLGFSLVHKITQADKAENAFYVNLAFCPCLISPGS